VVDRGRGVPDSDKGRIFEPFQRYGDTPRGDGVGLGLAVARGFVEAMHGTLDAEDTPGGGMTMVLTLPTTAPAGATASAGTVSTAEPATSRPTNERRADHAPSPRRG
jgi:two-component system sensor histidine kinase KdpD